MNFEDFEFEEIDTAKKLHEFVKSKIKDSTLNCSLFVTGSNSKLLSGELETLLVGRTSITF